MSPAFRFLASGTGSASAELAFGSSGASPSRDGDVGIGDPRDLPGNRRVQRDGGRATVRRQGRRQSSGRLSGQPASRTDRRTGDRPSARPGCASGRIRRATGGSDGTKRGRPRGGPTGDAPPTGPKGNRRTRRDSGRATVSWTGRTQLSGWPSGRPAGRTERRAGNRLPGRPGATLRQGRPGNRRAGRNEGRATARRDGRRRPSDGSKGQPADPTGRRTGDRPPDRPGRPIGGTAERQHKSTTSVSSARGARSAAGVDGEVG
jgi:hypothetical protein